MNNKNSEVSNSSAVSFPMASILTIVFVVLKLTHTIDWSWWWVLSPIWISALFVVAVLVVVFLIVLAIELFKG